MLFWRGCDADMACRSVVWIKLLEIYTSADGTFQHDGSQVDDNIDSEMEVNFSSIGMDEFKILDCIMEIPVLLIQSDSCKDLTEGYLIFLLVRKEFYKV